MEELAARADEVHRDVAVRRLTIDDALVDLAVLVLRRLDPWSEPDPLAADEVLVGQSLPRTSSSIAFVPPSGAGIRSISVKLSLSSRARITPPDATSDSYVGSLSATSSIGKP